jgi:CRISPR-associated protein Csx1
VSQVRSLYLDFVKERIGLDLCGNLKVVVAPGVGTFKVNNSYVRFEGSLSDFYVYVLFKLYEAFSSIDDDLVIHLDLSHGVNFMPSLTLAVLERLLGSLSLAKNVRLKVYNSEPYVRDVTKELTIHLVEDKSVSPRLDPKPLATRGKCALLKAFSKLESPEEREVLREASLNDEELSELNAFLSSIVNGLPLALYTFYPDSEDLKGRIERVVELWRGAIKVIRREGETRIVRRSLFTDDFAKLVVLGLVARALKLSRKEAVSLEELHEVRKRFFSRWSRRFDIMISSGLHEIENAVKDRREALVDGRWVRLRAVLCEARKGVGGFDPRHFLAHSGLERNVTELMVEGPEIKLRYAPEELKKVLDASSKGLAWVG